MDGRKIRGKEIPFSCHQCSCLSSPHPAIAFSKPIMRGILLTGKCWFMTCPSSCHPSSGHCSRRRRRSGSLRRWWSRRSLLNATLKLRVAGRAWTAWTVWTPFSLTLETVELQENAWLTREPWLNQLRRRRAQSHGQTVNPLAARPAPARPKSSTRRSLRPTQNKPYETPIPLGRRPHTGGND